jgi:hypothetical protein
MRTTIRLDDRLLAEAKRYAAESGQTLTGLIEEALRLVLARRAKAPLRQRIELTTCGQGGTLPGVDLDNSADLLDLMESGG